MLVGTYSIEAEDHYQLNFAYRYTPWAVPFDKVQWRPFQIGLVGLHSLDYNRYFLRSPVQYPQDNYYEQTLIRLGLELGQHWVVEDYSIGLSYYFRLLDNGFVALYNNTQKDLQYYTSSGLGITYFF